jgi:hypothetical protein
MTLSQAQIKKIRGLAAFSVSLYHHQRALVSMRAEKIELREELNREILRRQREIDGLGYAEWTRETLDRIKEQVALQRGQVAALNEEIEGMASALNLATVESSQARALVQRLVNESGYSHEAYPVTPSPLIPQSIEGAVSGASGQDFLAQPVMGSSS